MKKLEVKMSWDKELNVGLLQIINQQNREQNFNNGSSLFVSGKAGG